MTLADLTGYQVLYYFQGRGSTNKIWFTDTLELDSVYREGYLVIQITLPSGAYLKKNSTFDLSLKYDMSTVSSISAKAVLYGPNYVTAGDAPIVNVNTSTNTISFSEGYNNKSQLSVIEIWLTLGGMEWVEAPPKEGTFTVSGYGTYTFLEGMTWNDWLSSAYNTKPFKKYMDRILVNETTSSRVFLCYDYNDYVDVLDFVESRSYSTTSMVKTTTISDVTYQWNFSIKSINISTMDEEEIQGGILGWIKNIFNSISNLPKNIASSISGFFDELGNKVTALGTAILDGIKGLFIPSEESLIAIKDDFEQLLADRFGAVYESTAVIDNFANAFFNQAQVSAMSEGGGTISFPLVSVPLAGTQFTFGGWDVDIVPDGFSGLVDACKIIIDIICTFVFVNALRKRLEEILS